MSPEKVTRRPARRAPVEALRPQDHVDELFNRLDSLQKQADVDAVFGQPVVSGDKTLIPIASVTYAFGLGFEESQGAAGEGTRPLSDGGAGGGAGVIARPLGLAEITPEHTRIEPVVDEQAVALAGIVAGAWAIFWIARAVIKILRR